jgi:membrane dipeptidase
MSLLTALSPVYTRYIPIIIVVNILLFTHISGQQPPNDEKLRQLADKLAHQFIIVDGHVDLPYRLLEQDFIKKQDFASLISTTSGDFDYERAKKGGLSAPFMSIYVPSGYQLTGGAKVFADTLIDMVAGIAAHFPDKFALADSPEQVLKNFKKGLISLPMGMENGAPIEDDLANVAYFHQRHIRYITLTHGKDNQICDSSYDTLHTWHGVSPFGEKVIAEMNRTGIMIDVSHLSDEAFYDVMKLSKKPCIASHSSCRHFTPGWERNMNDEMIAVLAKNDGVIQINFGTMFLDNTYRETNRKTSNQLDSLLKIKGLTQEDEKAKPYIDAFRKTHPKLYADVALVADHIDHAVRIAGIDHVGLGSDYDGVGDNLPEGLKDVSQYPNLIYELLKRGYSKKDIAKICYKNVFRVWNEVSKSKV